MDVLILTTYDDAPFMNQQLAALERRGITFETLTVDGDVSTERTDLSRGPLDYLKFFPQVIRESANGYDLVHAQYGLTAPMALAQLRTPVVLSLWGSDVHGTIAPISKLCAPLCDEVIVMSSEMRERLGRECHVIPDGVDLEKFAPRPQGEALEAVGWDERAHNVLFPYDPGRTVKNYPRARRIVETVNDGFDRPVELRTISGVDHDEVSTYMNAADALLLTSHSEGSPNSVKEAMACNLPVVAVDVGDVREQLTGVDPSVVATDDAELAAGLRAVLERGERSNGREAARAVSLERVTDAVLEVYDRAV